MSVDYQVEKCRNFYVKYRKAVRAPAMLALKHIWGWAVEAKDGSVYKEYCEQTHCAWCVKSEGINEWVKIIDSP